MVYLLSMFDNLQIGMAVQYYAEMANLIPGGLAAPLLRTTMGTGGRGEDTSRTQHRFPIGNRPAAKAFRQKQILLLHFFVKKTCHTTRFARVATPNVPPGIVSVQFA